MTHPAADGEVVGSIPTLGSHMRVPTKDPENVECPRHEAHTSQCPNGCGYSRLHEWVAEMNNGYLEIPDKCFPPDFEPPEEW